MASILIKNIKLSRLSKFRLSFRVVKSNYQSFQRNGVACRYATAAFKHVTNEEPSTAKSSQFDVSNLNTDLNSIDKALENIDWIIRGRGRIMANYVVDALSLVTKKNNPTSIHALYLLRSCKYMYDEPPSKRIELLNKIWKRMQDHGVKFDVRHYNALLQVYTINSFVFDPAEILNSMEEKNIEPDRVTCLLLMKKYCRDGNLNGASEILEYMKEKGFVANQDVFNNLIQGHLNNNDIAAAEEMLGVMRSSNLKPTEDTYCILACGYALKGDKSEMMSCLQGKNEVIISGENYLKVIETLACSGNDHYIDDVLGLMKNVSNYNQECVNTALQLIHKGFVKTAYKLIVASSSPQYNYGVNIFIRQIIKANQPAEEIVHYCKDISSRSFDNYIFLTALKAASECGNIECGALLLKESLAEGIPVRSNTFLPFFINMKKEKSVEGIWLIVRQMWEFGVPINFSMYTNYVYPAVGEQSPGDIIQNIKESGHCINTAVDALFHYYCHTSKIDLAFDLIQMVPVNINPKLPLKLFLAKHKLFVESKEEDKYFQILRFIFENAEQVDETGGLQGKFLADLISSKSGVFETFRRKFANENFKFNEKAINVCEKILRKEHPSCVALLGRYRNELTMNDMTAEEEDREINLLLSHQKSCKSFLVERIHYHIRKQNISRMSELVALYDKMEFAYSPLLLAQLLSQYSITGELEKAKTTFSKLKNEFPSFNVTVEKILNYAVALIECSKFDEALDVLKSNLCEPYNFTNKYDVSKRIKKLIAVANDTKNTEFIKSVHSVLMPASEQTGNKKSFLESVINAYLQGNDLNSALLEYEKCISQRIPASLNNILKKCIKMSDKISLQKVIDMTIDILGRNVALIELSIAFIECGRSQTAATVIEDLGEEADQLYVEDACSKLSDQNKLHELEQFISIIKSLDHIDQKKLYHHLIRCCASRNDCGKAIDVFNALKEEGVYLPSETVKLFTNLLKQNNQPNPITLLSQMSSVSPSTDSSSNTELSLEAIKPVIDQLLAGDAELVLKELNGLKKGHIRALTLRNLTGVFDLCLQNNCIDRLSTNEHVMSYIIDNAKDVLTPLFEKYSASGDVQKLTAISTVIPDFSLRRTGFNSYFAQSYFANDWHEDFLSKLEELCDAKVKFFSITGFETLLKFTEFEDRVLKLAIKYYENSFHVPMCVVWAHYFNKENYDKANELQKTYPCSVERIDHKILKNIKQSENISLGRAYIDFINKTVCKQVIKERAYGTVISLLVSKQMYDEAVSLVIESENLNLHLLRSTLLTLKSALEKENKPVPFSIPSGKLMEDSSSDSD